MLKWSVIIIGIKILLLTILLLKSTAFSVRADGVTITLPLASFYIPSKTPTKVYKFDPHPSKLSQIIEQNTKDIPATFGIYIKNISTGQEVSLNADHTFSAASLYKLAVMHTIYQKGAKGDLNISSPEIQNNLKAMITVSSNEAAYLLVDKYTSWSEVTNQMHSLGLKNTTLNKNPTETTPQDMGKLLEMMALGKTVNMEASISMLELMLAQERNDRIPVHLPSSALVAHKTGELEDVRHDAGVIISPENNFILVLMSKDSQNPESVKPIMSKISFEVYDFFAKQWANPPEIL